MPAVSAKQKKFMQAVANNPKFAKKVGVPQSVGKEFSKSGGGEMKESKSMMKKEVAFMKKKGAPKSMIKHEKAEYGMKSGGKAYAGGGMTPNEFLKTVGQKIKMARDMASTPARPAPRTMKPAGGRMSMMKSGGLAAGHKAADGIAKKGRTATKQVKMMRGGSCS